MNYKNNGVARTLITAASALALAACQGDAASEAQSESSDVFATSGNFGNLSLEAMPIDEMEEFDIDGELQCYFAQSPADDPLLLASGFMDSPDTKAEMLVKFAGEIVMGRSTEAGGYDAIVDGSTFDTAAMVIDVISSDAEASGGGSLRPFPAVIRVSQPAADPQEMDGFWTCGQSPQF